MDIAIVFAILGVVVVLFVWNRVPVELVAIGAALALYATGILRIDQAFVNAELLGRLKDVRYVWGGASRQRRRTLLSDHAALVIDF